MPRCETCLNYYDKTFELKHEGGTYVFDCFECAIHALAPVCVQCGCRILGHRHERRGDVYCSASCASRAGIRDFADRIEEVVVEL